MKRDTRQEILNAARTLFNQYGYNGVSLRDIAEAVGISKGNLTYHFSKKEDIIESLLDSEKGSLPPQAPGTIRELDTMFINMQKTVVSHSYFFLHHTQLGQISENIFQRQRRRYKRILPHLNNAFATLRDNGFFRPELFEGEYERLIDMLYMSIIYWAPFSRLQQATAHGMNFRRHIWGALFHLLTEKGRRELDEILAECNIRGANTSLS
ncbi:MAG TPA: TetR/AcrR family transcriptional regulator [Papillibacter sp.]|nr:TetR/AcrR family transcriptional regulator [Papillibacter sp.]